MANTTTHGDRDRPPRWVTRLEAMSYARIGSTTMNVWLREGRVVAKKLSASKILVDLNSVDDLINDAPSAAAAD